MKWKTEQKKKDLSSCDFFYSFDDYNALNQANQFKMSLIKREKKKSCTQ